MSGSARSVPMLASKAASVHKKYFDRAQVEAGDLKGPIFGVLAVRCLGPETKALVLEEKRGFRNQERGLALKVS